MTVLFAYAIALLGCTIVSVHLCAVTRDGERRLELTPSLLLAISYALYSSALPISRLLLGSPIDPVVDPEFVAPHILGALGILVGLMPWRRVTYPAREVTPLDDPTLELRPALVVAAVSIGIVWQIYVLLMQVSGNIAGLFSAYASGEGYNPPGFLGTLVVVTSNIAIATLVVAFPALRKRGPLRLFLIAATALLAALFAVRGHRNLLGILVLPILALHLFGRRVSGRKLLASLALAYLFLYGVGIIRNFGFAKLTNAVGNVDVKRAMDPMGGELGTSYSVFSRWQQIPVRRSPELGATYTRDVLLNLVPHQFWPDRPPTPSIQFSMDYYRTKDLKLGLGYSPVIEAMSNFGIWGILPIFALFAALVRRIETSAQGGGLVALLAYGYLVPAVVNWNRIDMATNVKMFLVSTCIAAALRFVLYERRERSPAFGLSFARGGAA